MSCPLEELTVRLFSVGISVVLGAHVSTNIRALALTELGASHEKYLNTPLSHGDEWVQVFCLVYFGGTRCTLRPERNDCIGVPVTLVFVSAHSLPSASYLISCKMCVGAPALTCCVDFLLH